MGNEASGQDWHQHLAGMLRTLGFTPTRYDHDVFMRVSKTKDGYDYIGCYTDDLLIMARDTQKILDQLMQYYEISEQGCQNIISDVITVQLHLGPTPSGILAAKRTSGRLS